MFPPARVDGDGAFVSIMEGCSKYCSLLRRALHARRRSLAAVRRCAAPKWPTWPQQGVKEVTLLGQNVNAYRGRMSEDGDSADFAFLLRVSSPRCRASSASATPRRTRANVTQRLIDVYGRMPKLVSHLHLPVQSGSDRILAAMKRGYTALEYKSIIRKSARGAAGHLPVVGFHRRLSRRDRCRFRGDHETDRRCRLRRQSSASSTARARARRPPRLADDTPPEVKLARLHAPAGAASSERPQQVSDAHGRHRAARAGRGYRAARTPTNWPAAPTTTAWSTSSARRGLMAGFVDVRITQALPHSLARRASLPTPSRASSARPLPRSTPISRSNCVLAPLDNHRLANLCGALDENLRQIETALDVTHRRRGERFSHHRRHRAAATRRAEVLERFYDRAKHDLTLDDIQLGLVEGHRTRATGRRR